MIDQEDEGLFDIFEEFENMIMHLMLKLMDVSTIFFYSYTVNINFFFLES